MGFDGIESISMCLAVLLLDEGPIFAGLGVLLIITSKALFLRERAVVEIVVDLRHPFMCKSI